MRRLAAVALLSIAVVALAGDCPRGLLTAERAVSMSGSGVTGDFNRDGKPDFAALAGSDLLTFLNRGNSVFQPQPSLFEHTFTSPALAEARDVNGDGNLDVVISSLNSIAVRPGDGKGGFGDAIVAGNLGLGSPAVLADLDGDGINEWITISDTTVTIWKLVAPGARQKVTDLTRKKQSSSSRLSTGDYNGDGRIDILAGAGNSFSDEVEVEIFTQQPDGTFTDQVYPSVLNLTSQSIDLGGGGAEVLSVSQQIGHLILTRFRNGQAITRTLDVPGLPSVLSKPRVFDFDHDGLPDLLFMSGTALGIAWGTAPGALGHVSMYDLLGQGFSLADMDGDGITDLVSSSSTEGLVVVHGRNHSRDLDAAPIFTGGLTSPTGSAVADFDGDGKSDFAASGSAGLGDNRAIVISYGNGQGGFDTGPLLSVAPDTYQIVAADFDGDAKVDLAMSGTNARILFGNGGRAFGTASLSLPAMEPIGSLRTRPQDPPVLIAIQSGNVVAVTISSGRSATTQVIGPAPTSNVTVSAGGDVLVRTNVITIYRWNGQQWTSRTATQSVDMGGTTADLNGDGITDLITYSAGPAVFTGKADGTFQLTWSAQGLGFVSGSIVTDIDGDGKLDLVLSERRNTQDVGTIRIEHGDGTGKFTHYAAALVGDSTNRQIFAADADQDADPDVVVVTTNGPEVLRNVCATPRVKIAMQPEHPLEGQRVSFVVQAQTARLDFGGPIIITENGTNLVPPETIRRYDTLSWTSQPLTPGHHVYTLRYEDFYAGNSESTFAFDVSVPAAHRRVVR